VLACDVPRPPSVCFPFIQFDSPSPLRPALSVKCVFLSDWTVCVASTLRRVRMRVCVRAFSCLSTAAAYGSGAASPLSLSRCALQQHKQTHTQQQTRPMAAIRAASALQRAHPLTCSPLLPPRLPVPSLCSVCQSESWPLPLLLPPIRKAPLPLPPSTKPNGSSAKRTTSTIPVRASDWGDVVADRTRVCMCVCVRDDDCRCCLMDGDGHGGDDGADG
jgi:hypothetical protein